MTTAASTLLFLSVIPWPDPYYRVLGWVVCGICGWLAYLAAKSGEPRWAGIMGIAAVLFNPFAPMYLPPGMWTVADVAVGISLFCLPKHVLGVSKDQQSTRRETSNNPAEGRAI